MKTLKLLTFYLLMGMLSIGFYSCSSDDEPEVEQAPMPFLDIEKERYEISSEAQTIDVRVHTNIKDIYLDIIPFADEWISVSKIQQADENEYFSYQLNVKENTSNSKREGSLKFRPQSFVPSDVELNNFFIIIQDATP
ncbi:MAG: BACON domain-containing protein [Bacteroidaceae bacterium]|nr:BACON domain-containing protein [Bacteroidaceae bacterium]